MSRNDRHALWESSKTGERTRKEVGSAVVSQLRTSAGTDILMDQVHFTREEFIVETVFRWGVEMELFQSEGLITVDCRPIDEYLESRTEIQKSGTTDSRKIDLGSEIGERDGFVKVNGTLNFRC